MVNTLPLGNNIFKLDSLFRGAVFSLFSLPLLPDERRNELDNLIS
jgi:hypothetical protein